jgi:hypothetical protein
VEQSPSPADAGASPPPKSPNDVATFVIGLLVGLGVGGTVLTMIVMFAVAALIGVLAPKAADGAGFLFAGVVPALALGWWAVVLSRKVLNFVSGFVIGLAAGLLGGTSLCALVLGGLSNTH